MSVKSRQSYGWFILFLCWGIFFHRALLFKGVYFYYDHLMHNYPNRMFLFENLKKGTLPLWSPTMFGGFPLLAEGQHCFFYPVSFVFFYFLPFPYAYNLNIVCHFLLAGTFTYLFIKLWDMKNEMGGAAAGIVYMLSGYFVVHHMHLNIIQAVAYFPVLVYLIEKFIRSERYLYLVVIAFGSGFLALGGHPQMVIFVLFFSGIYFLYRLPELPRQKRLKSFSMYMVLSALGLMLAAVQLIPLFELIRFGSRQVSYDYNFLTYGSLPIKRLVTFVLPNFYGSPADNTLIESGGVGVDYYLELCVYSGIIPLLSFFILKKDVKNRSLIRFFTWLFLISVLLMLGRNTPVYRLFSYLPPFNLTRIPARLGFVSAFCLAIIVGLKWPLISFKKGKYADYLILLLIIGDLFYFGYNFNPLTDPKIYQPHGPITSFLKEDKGIWRAQRYNAGQIWNPNEITQRVDPFTPGWSKGEIDFSTASESLTPDTFTLNGIQTLDGFNQLQFSRFKEIMGAANARSSLIAYQPTFALLSLLNVKYLISTNELISSRFELVKSWADLKVYRNKYVLPRAFLVSDYEVVNERPKLLQIMRSDKFNPLEKVYFEETPLPPGTTKQDILPNVTITDYQNNQVQIDVQSPQATFLVLSDAYYPGWQAFLNEEPVKIYRADYILRGVNIPAGRHQLKFVFAPSSLTYGMWISSVTLVFLIAVGVFSRKRCI